MSASEDLTKINQAIADFRDGKRLQKLKINGKELTFPEVSIDDLLKLQRECEIRISRANSRRRIRSRSLSGGKGL